MSCLLPSELARLVLGFIEENGCQKASEYLLQELPDLAECSKLRRKGRRVNLRIGNKSLEDMLTDYTDSKDHVLDCLKKHPASFGRVLSTDSLHQQIKTITSIVIENIHTIKQGMSLGVIGKSKQMSRTCQLQKELRGPCPSLITNRNPIVMEINTTPVESLPGSSHREPIHVEIMADACSAHPTQFGGMQDHSHSTSSSPLVTPPAVTHAGLEEARGDSVGGDSTSVSLTGQEFDIVPQKRKGSQVKRRIQSSEHIASRVSPVLDNEASIEKILKNLYENTALHEKIAENINRGRNSQNKVQVVSDGDGEDYIDVAANADVSICGSLKKNKDASSPSAKGIVGVISRGKGTGDQSSLSGAGDMALLKELDHIVPGIISETTADPAFESLLEEVFGTPESAPTKNNGSYQASQGCMQEAPVVPARPLSTPVPPPTTTPISTSVPQQLPQPLLPLFRSPSSTLDATCTLSSHTLCSTPLHLSSPGAFHGPSSPTLASPGCIQRIQYPTISSPPHPPSSDNATSVADLTSKVPSKKRQKKMQSNHQVVVGGRVTRSTTRVSRLAASKVTSQNTTEDVAHDATPVRQMETQSPFSLQASDTCPSKTMSGSPITKCIQESAASETKSHHSNALASSDSTLKSSKSKSKKKKNSKSKKIVKEDERSLGEQLLQEFANFQSSRPDKVSESEGSGDSQKIESLELEKRLRKSESGVEVQTPVPESDPCASGAVNSSPHGVAFSDTGRGELLCVAQEPCKHPAALTSHNATIVFEDTETEEAAASAVISSPKSLPSPSKKLNLISKNLVMKNSQNESDEVQRFVTVTKLFPDKPYDKELQMPEASKSCENDVGVLTMMPSSTMPVRSTTIPGIASVCSAVGQEEYTLTELIPVNPNAVPYLDGTYSVEQETGILYPIPLQNCTPLSQNIIPGNLDLVPASISTPSTSCPVSEKQVIWDTSTGVLPVSAEDGVFRSDQMAQGTQLMQQIPQVIGGNDEYTTTIVLPPVRKDEENEGHIITLSSGDGMKDHQTTMMILHLPAPSLPIIPRSLGIGHGGISSNRNKKESLVIKPGTKTSVHQAREHGEGRKYPNAVKGAPILIAPKGNPSNLLHAQTTVFSGEESDPDLQSYSSYTSSNNVSFSMSNCSSYSKCFMTSKRSDKRRNPLAEEIKKNSQEVCSKTVTRGKVVNVTKEKKRGIGKARKQTKRIQKDKEKSVLRNNIISTALSFALNSLSPNKDTELSGCCKSPGQVSPHRVAEPSVAGKSAGEFPSVDNYCNEMVPEELQANVVLNQAQDATIEQTLLRTSSKNDKSTNAEAAEQSPSDARSSIGGQKENTEQNIHVESAENADASESVKAKYNTSRSPQLKALLHLSQSISPSKKFVARRRMFSSNESPFVGGFPKRGSQSTPSRKSSHIRALDFSTPQKHKAHGRSPRKVVSSLRFSPPACKRSPKKTTKSPLSNPSRIQGKHLPKKNSLRKIPEENEITSGNIDIKEDAESSKKNIGKKELISRKGSLSLSSLEQRKISTASTSEESMLRRGNVSYMNNMLHVSEEQQQHVGRFDAEDDESLVLRIEDDDSLSSDIETQGTDTGSIELFEMPKEMSSLENLRQNKPSESSCNLDAKMQAQDPTLSLTSHIKSVTVQTDAICSSNMFDQYDAKRMKTLKTPYKDGELLCSYSNEVFPITPICLEPTTPIFPSECRTPFSQDDDLNTPVPPLLPKTPAGKSPLIKDYPQGPYSNSSVSTSYYVPSEHSITDSEGCSPSRLETVWEKTLIEELSSPTSQGKNSPECSRGNASFSRMSRKVMGEVIEQEMVKLFSGDTSCSASDIQVQNCRSFNTHSSLDTSFSSKIETKLKDPSKGKQGKQRRVPSKKYQNLAESTCSEDEVEHSSLTTSSDLSINQNHKPLSNVLVSNAKVNKGKGFICSAEDNDAALDAFRTKKPSPHELSAQKVRQRQRNAVVERKKDKQVSLSPKSDTDDVDSKIVVRKQYRRRKNKSVAEGTVKSVKESEKLMNHCNVAIQQNTSESKTPSLSTSNGNCPVATNDKIAHSDSKRRTAYQVKDSESVVTVQSVPSPSSICCETDLTLVGTSVNKLQEVKRSSSRGRKKTVSRALRKPPAEKNKGITPIASKANHVSAIFGSDFSFTDESDSEIKRRDENKAIRKMETSQSCVCLNTSMIQGLQEETQNSKRRNQRSTRGRQPSRGGLQTSEAPAVIPNSRPARMRSNRVKRGCRTLITRQRASQSKLPINIDVKEVTTEALIGDLPEVAVLNNEMEKETSKAKAVVKGKGISQRSMRGRQPSRGGLQTSKAPAVIPKSRPTRMRSNRVKRGGRTPITRQRAARSKLPVDIDVKEVTIEALIGGYSSHLRSPSEDGVLGNEMEKETSKAKAVVKGKGIKRSKAIKKPRHTNNRLINATAYSLDTLMQVMPGLKKLDVVAEVHKPPEINNDGSEGVVKDMEHFEKCIRKESISNDAYHQLKQPMNPFSSWGSESRLPVQAKSECFVTPCEDLSTRWSASLALHSPLFDVNITDTEDESPGVLLHQAIPEQITSHPKTMKGLRLSTHSSGCARTISFTNIIPKEVPRHRFEAEDLGEIHSVTPRRTGHQRTGNSGSCTSEPLSDVPHTAAKKSQSPAIENSTDVIRKKDSPSRLVTMTSDQLSSQNEEESVLCKDSLLSSHNIKCGQQMFGLGKKYINRTNSSLTSDVDSNSQSETVTLCAQDSEGVALVPAASISSLLGNKHLLELEKKIEMVNQECLKVTTCDKFYDMPQKSLAEKATFHKNFLTSNLSKEVISAESPKPVKSASDLLKSSEQQHVISHEPLPAPKKKSNQICHSVVSENLPITSQIPISASQEKNEVYTQSQNSKSLNNENILCETYVSCTENAKSEGSCIGDMQERENLTVDFKRADICQKTEKNISAKKNFFKNNHLEVKCLPTLNSEEIDINLEVQVSDNLTGPHNLKLNNKTDEISGGKHGDKEESRTNTDRESHSICESMEQEHVQSSVQIEQHEKCGDAREELDTLKDSCTINSNVNATESKKNENSDNSSHANFKVLECLEETNNSHAEKEVKEKLKMNTQEKDVHLKEAIGKVLSTELRVDDVETKMIEEEEDSDVLRIEVPSENENDDSDDLLERVHLRLTDFISILGLNLEPKGKKAKRAATAKLGKIRALKNSEAENEMKGKGLKKGRTRQLMAGRKQCGVGKLKKSLRQREKNENNTQESISKMDSKIHSRDNEGIISFPENVHKEANFVSIGNCHENLISESSNAEVHSTNQKRIRDENSSGDSSELIKKKEFHQSPIKKRRRIQPTRIGEVEKISCQTKKDWTEKEDKGRILSGHGENKISSRTEVPCQVDKNDDSIQGQHEKAMGPEYGSLRREVLLNSGAGGLSERSVSSLSSISPGRLLISESPRDLDSSPAQHCDPAAITSPHCASTGSPTTKSYSPIARNPDGLMTTQSTPLDSCIHQVPVNHCEVFVDGIKMIQERAEAESEPRASVSYLIESETSRELDEDIGYGRQRRARQMASELYSGGSLEIAHSPEKQLAIVTNHQNYACGLQMSEESANSLSSVPPTPGKHLFVPPAPASTVLSSGSTASNSCSNHESVTLPLKKRRKMIFVPEPVKRKQAQKLAKRVNISKFLDKIHQGVQQPKEPSGSDFSSAQT